jgi:3-hydroxybutyryl-CoA dehydrogenase
MLIFWSNIEKNSSSMNILIVGSEANYEESKLKFGANHQYTYVPNHQEGKKHFRETEVIFDFTIAENPKQIVIYNGLASTVFLNTTTISLIEIAAIINHEIQFTLFGFCGLSSFLNRSTLEVSLYKEQHKEKLQEICDQLNTPYAVVADRVGFVTPRVICMIINEAYYTVQEGTATREDIDLAMKLGTNYPYGPFEWAKRIGLANVFELLEALFEDTKDERYKICPLLKKEHLSLAQ